MILLGQGQKRLEAPEQMQTTSYCGSTKGKGVLRQ